MRSLLAAAPVAVLAGLAAGGVRWSPPPQAPRPPLPALDLSRTPLGFAREQARLLVRLDGEAKTRLPGGSVFAALATHRRIREGILRAADEAELRHWESILETFIARGIDAVPALVSQAVDREGRALGVYALLEDAGIEHPRALVLALIRTESSFDSDSVSRAGAKGLMQVMPATAADYGFHSDLLDLDTNLRAGLSYFRDALKEFKKVDRALAAYNAGIARVRTSLKTYHDLPPIPETRAYVRKVLAEYRRLTPPSSPDR